MKENLSIKPPMVDWLKSEQEFKNPTEDVQSN